MIPVFDLTRQYKDIGKELNTTFTRTASNGSFILGKNVSKFEKQFAKYVGAPYGVGLASGTDALALGLKALGIGTGYEVILPANVYPSAFGVALSGARIRLVDVKEDGTMDPTKLEKAFSRRTRAVIPVHLYGNPADTKSIKKLIRNKHILLVEDAAQAHGTKGAGVVGDIGCFSFYPSKNLGALGDGGMVVTHSKTIAGRLQRLRMYGEVKRYHSEEIAGVSRLDELHAAWLLVKLKHLPSWVRRRREIARQYIRGLTGIGDIQFVSSQESSYHLFVMRTKHRDALRAYLSARKIGTAIHYPTPIHLVSSFRFLGYKKGDFSVAEAQAREVVSIPMVPELTDREVRTVIRSIQKFFHGVLQ